MPYVKKFQDINYLTHIDKRGRKYKVRTLASFPELLKEFHSDNDISPYKIASNDKLRKVKWICSQNPSHGTWINSPFNRTQNFYRDRFGCVKCGELLRRKNFNETILKRGTLASKHPIIAKELHPTLNKLTAEEISPSSDKQLMWWQCPKHKEHIWKASVGNRTAKKPSGCPSCKPSTSKQEIIIYCEMKYLFEKVEWRRKFNKKEIDIFIPRYNLGIEFDGGYRHRGRDERDYKKNLFLNKLGIKFLRIRDSRLDRLDDSDTLFHNKDSDIAIVTLFLKQLLKYAELSENDVSAIEKYLLDNKLKNFQLAKNMIAKLPFPPKEASLSYNFPSLLDEWDYVKNNPLTPDMVWPGSNVKLHWICKVCNMDFLQAPWHRTGAGAGCPYCAKQKTRPDFNLELVYPEIVKSWHPTKNLPLTPEEISPKSSRLFWWVCLDDPKHPDWKASPKSRSRIVENGGVLLSLCTGCKLCGYVKQTVTRRKLLLKKHGSVAVTNPSLVKYWHPDNDISPHEITYLDNIHKIKFICSNDKNHPDYSQTMYSKYKGNEGCHLCSKIKRSKSVTAGKISITFEEWCKKNNPDLMNEYSSDNVYKPSDISYGSGHKVKWKCLNYPRHPLYESALVGRTTRGDGCKLCANEKRGQYKRKLSVLKHGSAEDALNNIHKYWDNTNELLPSDVSPTSGYKAKIRCTNDHITIKTVQKICNIRSKMKDKKFIVCSKCKIRMYLL